MPTDNQMDMIVITWGEHEWTLSCGNHWLYSIPHYAERFTNLVSVAEAHVRQAHRDVSRETSVTLPTTQAELMEMDRNARAYGYEIGRGVPLGKVVDSGEGNPFMDPDWRAQVSE